MEPGAIRIQFLVMASRFRSTDIFFGGLARPLKIGPPGKPWHRAIPVPSRSILNSHELLRCLEASTHTLLLPGYLPIL